MEIFSESILTEENLGSQGIEPEQILHYEKVLNAFFRRLGLKSNQCQLIRAFLEVSQGNKCFETSYLELADILFGKDAASKNTLKKRIEEWRKVLIAWQQKNGLELIRIVKKGNKKETQTGRFDFHKTKYEFVMLDELLKLAVSSSSNIGDDIEQLISRFNGQWKLAEKVKKYHPRHQIKKNKKDILTKFEKIFELMVEIDENPVDYCRNILNKARGLLNEMEDKWIEQQNRENIISKFENLLNNAESPTSEEDLELRF